MEVAAQRRRPDRPLPSPRPISSQWGRTPELGAAAAGARLTLAGRTPDLARPEVEEMAVCDGSGSCESARQRRWRS
eukprot:359956-Chlamydomonas_euryale.AAC.2